MSNLMCVLGLVTSLALVAPSAFAVSKTPDLVKLCKKECPGAKDLDETVRLELVKAATD